MIKKKKELEAEHSEQVIWWAFVQLNSQVYIDKKTALAAIGLTESSRYRTALLCH